MSSSALGQAVSSAPNADSGGQAGAELEEITVTAQHRNERLQDTPIAITSVSSAALSQQGVSSTSDLAQAVPSLIFNSQVNVASPYIRGVGSNQFDPTSESPVAMYVDDVYMAAPQGNIFSLAGIKQIDVLNGPQGTLFGRNATGGVIQIQTLEPTRDPHLDASVTYGNHDFVAASVYASGGFRDRVSTSLSALYENQGNGYGHNLFDGSYVNRQSINNISLRNKWVFDLPTGTVLHLSADYSKLHNNNSYQRAPGSIAPFPGAGAPLGYPGEYNTNIDQPDFTNVRTDGVSLKVDQSIGSITLTSITAYRQMTGSNGLDQDQSDLPVINIVWDNNFHDVSQEVRIGNRTDSTFTWMVGGFYYRATGDFSNLEIDGGIAIPYDKQETRSTAGFAQGTLALGYDTNLTGGFRYTSEDQSFVFPAFNVALKQDFKQPTYRIALDHHFTQDVLGYVSFNTGFKSGGYSLLTPGNAFNPEKLKAYEVGAKSEWLNRTLRLNVDGFFYQYTDQQVLIATPAGNIIANAAGSHVKGLEANVDYIPTAGLTLNGGVSLMNSHFTDYPGFQPLDPLGNPIGGPINAKGQTTISTPKFVGNLSARYTLPTTVGNFSSTVGIQHNNGFFWSADNRVRQPSYTVVNASISWRPNESSFEAKVWGKNLLDATYYSVANPAGFPVGDTQEQAPPRTFGVTLAYHY